MHYLSLLILSLIFLAGCSCEQSGCPYGDDSCSRTSRSVSLDNESNAVSGTAKFSHRTFENPLTVSGALHAKKVTFADLTVSGAGHLRQCTVKGQSSIQGSLYALKTDFENRIVISGTATFDECTTHNIFVTKSYAHQPEIHLTHGTIVNGSVSFEDSEGIVYTQGHSQVKGEVKGGKIIQK